METHLTTTRQETMPLIYTKRSLIAAREAYPEFRHCAEAERSNRLYVEIQYAAVMDNQDLPKESLVVIAKEVGLAMIGTPAAGLTYPEIHTAIRNGAAGHYGDWYRINVRTILSWLDAFIEENKATYRELARQKDKERLSNMGEFYLEKVRYNMEQVRKQREEEAKKSLNNEK